MIDLTSLNEQQKEAVLHEGGPAIVLAGAGSGKTRVLTTRAAYLIEEKKVNPEQILLVTFTNKAANQMRQRVEDQTGEYLPFVSTFHSFAAKILRREAGALGLDNNFTIYDSDEQLSLIKNIYKEFGIDKKELKEKTAKAQISKLKNELLSPREYEAIAAGKFQELVARVYKLYQKTLVDSQALDFDDLLAYLNKLLANPGLMHKYQSQFEHVLVDEYQDTNKSQYQISKTLSQPQNNIFIVGDFSQSIYAWRGADYRNLNFFKNDYENIKEYYLEQNYRSSQSILDAASQVISQNHSHPILELWTENEAKEPCQLLICQDQNDEAIQVISEIQKLRGDHQYSDMAILYRTNAQSRSFEEACLSLGIPYKVIGGFKFYERKEVKDLLAYLKFILNPKDKVSKTRAEKNGKRRLEACLDLQEKVQLEGSEKFKPADLLKQIIKRTNYKDKFDPKDPDDLSRLENIEELVNTAHQFDNCQQFLENVALVQDNYLVDVDNDKNLNNQLTLMSLHSAKGLEFPVVFMVGIEEGLLPHSRSLFDKEQLEEERRLCYVGITRAMHKLYFSYAKKRFTYSGSTYNTMSRFLMDISPEILKGKETLRQAQGKETNKRHLVSDDDLDALLDGDISVDQFLEL